MKLKFKKVIINNFLSFGHAEIDLCDRGYTLINGINLNPKDAAKSNGSGKSTIFSAVCYALTGETIQGLSSNLNNIFTGEDMGVELDFDVDKDNFLIKRSRDTKGHADLKIIVNGVDKSGKGIRESQEILKNYLPDLTSDLVGEVIIVGQGMPHKFSNNTPSGRKDLLEKLSHSDFMLEDLQNRLSARSQILNDKKNSFDIEKAKKESTKGYVEKELAQKQTELHKYDNKPDFSSQITRLKEAVEKNTKETKTLNDIIAERVTSIEKLNNESLNLTKRKNEEIQREIQRFNDANISIKTSITENLSAKKVLCEEIKRLKEVKDVCPFCHQKIPHVHKQDTSAQEMQLSQLEETLKSLKEKDAQQNENFKLNKEQINTEFKVEEEKIRADSNKIKEEVNGFSLKLTSIKDQINKDTIELNKIIVEEKSFDEQKERCIADIAQLEKDKISLENEILYIIKEEAEVNKHQEIISKMITLAKRDFRGILLSSIISFIDKKCKEYSSCIFGTTELDFKLNGNNIDITYLNKPLEALSGGEQQKVDLILQFAIRAMMQAYTGFTSNIIVLDEILDNLDSVGCDAILNFITTKLSDIESVFIISHHADSLNIGNDSTITVIKDENGVSKII